MPSSSAEAAGSSALLIPLNGAPSFGRGVDRFEKSVHPYPILY